MTKVLQWLLISLTVIMLSACGGGSSTTNVEISGYAEDDPIAGAKVKLYDNGGNVISETKADENGHYQLDARVEKGKQYTLESQGVLAGQDVVLHSVFQYASNTEINTNPITELKYQLVRSGKSIDEAEALIRDYFIEINGETLEENRFDVQSSLAMGMSELAQLYGGQLPVDAVEKIKEDILNNDGVENKDFSYRNLVKNTITLEASAESVPVGEPVTVKVSGLSELNSHYEIKWSGVPEDANVSNGSVYFINTSPQNIFIRAIIYEKDKNSTIVSEGLNINYYMQAEEKNITISNSLVDTNFTIGENFITIPSESLQEGDTLNIKEYISESNGLVAKFEIESSGVENTTVDFHYEYDPYRIADPRKLQVSIKNEEGINILPIENINYEEHIITFKVPLENNIARDAINSYNIVNIEYTEDEPTKRQVYNFFVTYKKYIQEILEKYLGNENALKALEYLDTEEGMAKLVYILQQKGEDYNYNVLAGIINIAIAYEEAEKIFNDPYVSWDDAIVAYFKWKYNGTDACGGETCVFYGYNPVDNSWNVLQQNLDRGKFSSKIVQMNKIIAPWVGATKLTEDQKNFIRYAKLVTNVTLALASGDIYSTATGLGGAAIDFAWNPELGADALGYAYVVGTETKELINQPITVGGKSFGLGVAQGWVTGFLVNSFFNLVEENLVWQNTIATAPVFLSLSKNSELLPLDVPPLANTQTVIGYAMNKNDFSDLVFPEQDGNTLIDFFYNSNRNIIQEAPNSVDNPQNESQLGSILDPNRRLEKLFLTEQATDQTGIMDNGLISDEERGLAYLLMMYAYGNRDAGDFFYKLTEAGKFTGFEILKMALSLPDEYITEELHIDPHCGNSGLMAICTDEQNIVKIKDQYRIDSMDKFLNVFNVIRSSQNSDKFITDLRNFTSFETVMKTATLKFSDEQKNKYKIKKVKVLLYGIGLQYNEASHSWEIDPSNKMQDSYVKEGDLNSLFTYNSELGKSILTFDTLFSDKDFSQFDNQVVGMKVILVVEVNGREKVVDGSFVFSTLTDTEHVQDMDFVGSTLKSSVKDAATGAPIVNAQVTLVPGGLTDFTDEEGNYEVSGLAAGEYTILISKPGYQSVEATLTLGEDETKVYEVSLVIDDEHATTLGGADILVKDALNGSVITNGYIKVREGQNNKTGDVVQEIVNSDGNETIHIEMYPGIYTVEIGANGYTNAYNTVTILGDTNTSYEFSISPALAGDQVRIVLTWGESPSDLDSHLVRFTNEVQDYHVAYYDMAPADADANLDMDDTSSYGPETITINGVSNGSVYKYYVHDYSNGSDHNDTQLAASGAKVDVYYGDVSQTFYVPNETGNAWKVFEIVNGEIVPCTSECLFGVDGSSDEDIGLRSLTQDQTPDSVLFQDLPAK